MNTKFDRNKARQAAAILISQDQGMDTFRLERLMYLVNYEAVQAWGDTVFGGKIAWGLYGCVLVEVMKIVYGLSHDADWEECFERRDYRIFTQAEAGVNHLENREIILIQEVSSKHSQSNISQLNGRTHGCNRSTWESALPEDVREAMAFLPHLKEDKDEVVKLVRELLTVIRPAGLKTWLVTTNPAFGGRKPSDLILERDFAPLWETAHRLASGEAS